MQSSVYNLYSDLPLLASNHEIRVLVIKPGRRYSPIHASVDIISLDDSKRATYAALSYTWGGQPRTQPIFLYGVEVRVTPNLFDAIQHLRSPNVSLNLWADAVCINQDDNAEKSSQVAMMDDIYKKCEIVHIWLGCSEQPIPAHHSPFALVEHFRDDKHFFELPGYWWDSDTASWKCDTQDPDFRSMMDAFILIYNSTWWFRAWTAQEAILPKVALVQYGDWTLPLDDFWTCQLNRVRHLNGPCCVVAYEATGDAPGPRATIDHIMRGVDCIKSIQDVNSPFQTLLDVYRRFADRECSDPRDKIYSLVGFLRSHMPKLIPDYSREVGEIYVEVFYMMIREKGGNVSSLLGEGFNSGNWGLPSWVPDFSGTYAPVHFLPRLLRAYPLFNASGGRPGRLEVVADKNLRVTGFCIDKVAAKSKLINGSRAPNLGEILKDWRHTCRQQGIDISTTSRDDAFSFVLSGEMMQEVSTNYRRLQRDDPELPTDFQWEQYMSADSHASMLPRPYRVTVGCMVDRKALFVTSGRRIGLSWPVVEVGDEVWILDGANTPFLLRKPPIYGPDNHRMLVGDVYLYGVMNGEVVDEARPSEPVILV